MSHEQVSFTLNFSSVSAFIFSAIHPHRIWFMLILLLICTMAAIMSIQAYAIKLILNAVNQADGSNNIFNPLLFFTSIIVLSNIISRLYDLCSLKFYPKLKANLIESVTNQTLKNQYIFFHYCPSGQIANKIKNLSVSTAEAVQILLDKFINYIVAISVACYTLYTVNYLFAVILLLWAICVFIHSYNTSLHAQKLSFSLSESGNITFGYIVDLFLNILNVKLFNKIAFETKQTHQHLNDAVCKDKSLRAYLAKMLGIQGLMNISLLLAFIFILYKHLKVNEITVGDFGLVLTLSISLSELMLQSAKEIFKFSEYYGSIHHNIQVVNTKSVNTKTLHDNLELSTPPSITLQQVSLKYENSKAILQDLSAFLPSGKTTGLVGYSGSGKTTFINIILGLINIQKGKVFFNNQEITTLNPNAIFPFVSVISQNSTLFNRTIFENIAYSNLSATKHDIITAAKKACIHDFILSLPKQYDTLVGENGIRLSGGQKQRLVIARAILKDAQIIIFDEATTSLDAIIEKQIVNEWFELFKNKTCILVSHRLSTLTRSDNLLVFNNGQIIQQGTHQSLLKKNGLYKNLWDAYTKSHTDDIGELVDSFRHKEKII